MYLHCYATSLNGVVTCSAFFFLSWHSTEGRGSMFVQAELFLPQIEETSGEAATLSCLFCSIRSCGLDWPEGKTPLENFRNMLLVSAPDQNMKCLAAVGIWNARCI